MLQQVHHHGRYRLLPQSLRQSLIGNEGTQRIDTRPHHRIRRPHLFENGVGNIFLCLPQRRKTLGITLCLRQFSVCPLRLQGVGIAADKRIEGFRAHPFHPQRTVIQLRRSLRHKLVDHYVHNFLELDYNIVVNLAAFRVGNAIGGILEHITVRLLDSIYTVDDGTVGSLARQRAQSVYRLLHATAVEKRGDIFSRTLYSIIIHKPILVENYANIAKSLQILCHYPPFPIGKIICKKAGMY